MDIKISRIEEERLRTKVNSRNDFEAFRIRRYLAMPDLSRTTGSPLYELVERIRAIPDFKNYDVIDVPEIMGTDIVFDLFNFPKDHPARSRSDSYFIDDTNVLRTHTTVMWYYWLKEENVRKSIAAGESVGALSHGKVYRKDEIDRHHMNVFHQIDGWYLARREDQVIGLDELKDVLTKIAKTIYGENINYRFNKDQFPYTDPSLEMEIEISSFAKASADKDGRWVEVLGSGCVRGEVLENFGVDSSVWNGWAFGFGLERLAVL